jgi:hypothetical protein
LVTGRLHNPGSANRSNQRFVTGHRNNSNELGRSRGGVYKVMLLAEGSLASCSGLVTRLYTYKQNPQGTV